MVGRRRFLWRVFLHVLGVRRFTPEPWGPRPTESFTVSGDTSGHGFYRPSHRMQDPSVDPSEPSDGEGSSRGNDHGWSNCTMASGAMALDYHTQGDREKWGGHLRHQQGDLEGGTDLYDLRDAWAEYGEELQIRSGKGWDALKADRAQGRFLVVQGSGNVPGSATFDGGHACALGPETNEDGEWLWGDPLASGWQWVNPGAIRDWAERWQSSIAYARTAAHPPSEPEPEPEPPDTGGEPCQNRYADGYADGVAYGVALEADRIFRSWFGTVIPDPPPGVTWPSGCGGPKWDRHRWSSDWPIPMGAVSAAEVPATWGIHSWTGAVWT